MVVMYSERSLELFSSCLTALLTGTREQPVTERPEVTRVTDPAETAMNFAVALCDVEAAWPRLDRGHQKVLAGHLVYGLSARELGLRSQQDLETAIQQASEELAALMNGSPENSGEPDPGTRGPEGGEGE